MKDLFWKDITEYGTKITMPKDVVLNKNYDKNISNYVYLLEEGICALTSITKQGEEKVFLYFRPNRIIGFNQFVVSPEKQGGNNRPVFSVVTKSTCTLYQISSGTFRDLIVKNPKFNAFLLETLADNYNDALVHFHLMQEESAVVRLCHLLLEVSVEKNGRLIIPKFFTYGELARYLGCHCVTVSRIMAKLKQLGYISKNSKGIVIEKEKEFDLLINSEIDLKY